MFTSRVSQLGVFSIIAILLFSACTAAQPSAPPDTITVQLSWFHNSEFIGMYTADQLGYYKEENLVVNLLPGGPTIDPVAEVLSGKAQFGTTAGDNLIRSRAKNEDVVAVSSIFQQSSLVVMTLPENAINSPQDLADKKVGVISPGLDTTWDIQFLALLKAMGVDSSTMTFIPTEDYHGANELTSGRMDAMSGMFSTNEPVQAKLDGVATHEIFLSDYGIVIYVNPIFTTGDLVRSNPQLVQRFVRATLKGLQYSIEHPEESAEFILKYDNTVDMDLQRASIQAQIPLIDTGKAALGSMDASVWSTTQDVLLEQNIIQTSIDVN